MKKKSLTIKNEALEEIRSFQTTLDAGYATIVIAVFAVPVIGLTFGVDKLFKVDIKADAYAGAISFASSLALAGEVIALADRRKESIDRHTFFNLKIKELPAAIKFEDCYFEECTFDVDLSTAVLKRCSFSQCRFSSKIGRSVEDCRFWACKFSGATIDPGFSYRHGFSRTCDFSEVKTEDLYPNCPIDTDYQEEGWIGWLSCRHNARSPHLRCAVNPTGPCDGCPDFVRPPVLTDSGRA